ncbi:MAG: hypothetical protein J1E80_05545 [Desulfovibrionaceae bacterium]|nr:hypothetical protein [Desulfovibrionaceae bacterium]
MNKTFPSAPGPARAPGAGPAQAADRPRSAYQQRVDQIKVRIVELSHRNMENAMRILRQWLNDQGEAQP